MIIVHICIFNFISHPSDLLRRRHVDLYT